MASITLQGNPIETHGELPSVGTQAPDFHLTGLDLTQSSLGDYLGKRIILNIFPSVDTGTCSLSVKQFNAEASNLENTVILCISRDLPFGQQRFCSAEGIENLKMLSEYKDSSFSDTYGLRIMTGPLTGLLSRVVIIIDETGKIIYTEQVTEISQEPNYEKAIEMLA